MSLDFETIKELISKAEGNQIEFKKSTGQLDLGMETVCAFLNGSGGTVIFGVADNGSIIGQDVADSTKRNIAEHIAELEPSYDVEVSYISLPTSDKQIIALYVESAMDKRPFTYKGRPYMRLESTTVTMPQMRYDELLSNRDIYRSRWETIINEELTIEDLDENEILKTVRLGIESGRLPENTGTDITEILTRFELINHGKIKNAAAVLFAKRSLSDYPQCMLRLARFKGYNKTEFIDNKQVKGNLFVLLDAAMTFVFKHLSISGIVEGLERKERLSIPYPAIREGVINSLCHRQYRTLGASVGIAIYDDRLEIENPGSFPNDWDINELKTEHRSNPSNPLIANVLYKLKLLESWGRGIGLMVEECVKQGLPEPEFKMVNGFVVVTFRYTNDSLTTDKHLELLPQQHGKELARSWQGAWNGR